MKPKRQLLMSLATCVFGLCFSLVCGEVGLRLIYPLYASYNTEMWRYSKDIKVSVKEAGAGHEHRPNMKGNYYGVEIKTNSNGWRDREYSPTSDKYRIMVLGASIVMGWGVEEEKGFTKLLEKRLNDESFVGKPGKTGVEVVNTGVGNYNTEMQINAFFRKGAKFNPDQMLLFSYVSDSQLTHKPANPLLYPLMTSYMYALASDKWINFRSNHDPNWNFLKFYSAVNEPTNPGRIMMETAIGKLASYAKEKGIGMQIVVLPEMHQFKDYPFTAVTQAMQSIGDKHGVQVVDLLPYFLNEDPQSLWVTIQDPHPNAKGHALIAEGIHDTIFRKPDAPGRVLSSSISK